MWGNWSNICYINDLLQHTLFRKMYISLWVELICYWVTGEEQQRQGQRFTECRFKFECEVPTILGSQASSHHPLDVDPKFLSCNLTVPAGYFHPWVGRGHPNINTYTTRLWFKWSAACWSQDIFVHSILRVRPEIKSKHASAAWEI